METPSRFLADETYDGYVATTIDPGDTLFYIAVVICAGSFVLLPICVKFGRYLTKPKYEQSDLTPSDVHEGCGGVPGGDASSSSSSWFCSQGFRRMSTRLALFILENGLRSAGSPQRRRRANFLKNAQRRTIVTSRGVERERIGTPYAYEKCATAACAPCAPCAPCGGVVGEDFFDFDDDASLSESVAGLAMDLGHDLLSVKPSELKRRSSSKSPGGVRDGNERERVMANENWPTKEPKPRCCSPQYLRDKATFAWTIIKYDNETKRILRLVVPFTCSALTGTISELMSLAIISEALGTDAVIAWIMVETVLGTSATFTGGAIEAITSLGSMAYGCDNYALVGQYAKAACVVYVLCEIPISIGLGTQIGAILSWMDFDEETAAMAGSFVWVQVGINIVGGVHEVFTNLLEVAERETYGSVMYCLSSFTYVGLLWYFTTFSETILVLGKVDVDLVVLGYVMLANECLFTALNILIPSCMGWFKSFKLCTFNFGGWQVWKTLFKTAVPLSFGGLLAYAEWEILIILAAFLGPAETATWAILGFVWSVFESTTGAIGGASEIRCSYQLGKGRPALAKLSSYKSMYLAMVASILVSALFLSFGDALTTWLTPDATIQAMLAELLPFVALGNVTMNMGMVCWALIGAQGRYRLATSIATVCSFLITLPVGVLMTVHLRINLQGLIFAVVIGYCATSMLLCYVLLTSNWERLSTKVQDKMKADEDTVADTSSDDTSEKDEETEHGYYRETDCDHTERTDITTKKDEETAQGYHLTGPCVASSFAGMGYEKGWEQGGGSQKTPSSSSHASQERKSIAGASARSQKTPSSSHASRDRKSNAGASVASGKSRVSRDSRRSRATHVSRASRASGATHASQASRASRVTGSSQATTHASRDSPSSSDRSMLNKVEFPMKGDIPAKGSTQHPETELVPIPHEQVKMEAEALVDLACNRQQMHGELTSNGTGSDEARHVLC